MLERKLFCRRGERRFTVIQVGGNPIDSHAARSFEHAYRQAQPSRGAQVKVYAVCATDAGAARLPQNYLRRGRLLSVRRAKR